MSQEQIDAYTASIATIDAEIAMIDAEVIGATGVQEYVANRRTALVNRKNVFEFRRNSIQAVLEHPITSEEQTIIDGINTLFSNQFADHFVSANIINRDLTERNQFFSLYVQAETNVVRECMIRQFLRL